MLWVVAAVTLWLCLGMGVAGYRLRRRWSRSDTVKALVPVVAFVVVSFGTDLRLLLLVPAVGLAMLTADTTARIAIRRQTRS